MLGETIYDVVIVGAGPTGLTLANLLGLAGLQVLVLERNESTVRAPRAVSIDDESLRTMQAIGLTEEVMRDVAADYGSHYFDRRNRCFLRVEPTTREYGFPRRNAFTQPALEQTLLEGTRRFPNVTLCFCCTVESFTETQGSVLLSTKHADGSKAELNARYVVGCDGARSTLRKQIGAIMVGDTYPQRWLIIDLASTQERLRQTRVVCDPERPFLTLPGPHGIRRYEFMLHDGEDEAHATDPEFVRDLLRMHGPDADSPVVRRQVYTFHALIANRWNAGRVFIAGDAAHLSPPFAGQGMNSGIRDAFNLGWKLAAVIQGSFDQKLLDTYFEERAPHARELIQLAVRMGRIMMPQSRVHAWLTQTGFRLMRFAPAIQSYFAQMKYKPKPYYRRGFIAGSHLDRLTGRMIAQPTVEKLDRQLVPLDQLLGSGFSLVAFGPDAEQRIADSLTTNLPFSGVRRVAILPSIFNAQRTPLPGIQVARDLHGAISHLAPSGATVLMIVRPDRYIAAATSEASPDFAALLHSLVSRYVEREDAPNPEPSQAPAAWASRRTFLRNSLKLPLVALVPTLRPMRGEMFTQPLPTHTIESSLPMTQASSAHSIIDAHSHFLPDFYVAAMKQAGMTHPDGFNIPDWSPEQAIAIMDQHGIAAQVLSISSPGLDFTHGKAAVDLARRCNEYAAKLIHDHAPRFGAVALLPMANVDASLKEIEYALDTLKLDGIGLLSNYAGVYLGDPAFDAVFAELNRRKALVFVHPTSPPHFDSLSQGIAAPFLEFPFDTTRVAANLIKSGTMDRNRDLRLILTHGGGTIPYIYMRLTIAAGTDAKRALSAFHYDLVAATAPAQTGALASIVQTDHMTLGFDFPFMNPQFIAPAIEALAAGKFTAEQLQDIRGRNALALFPEVAARLTARDRV